MLSPNRIRNALPLLAVSMLWVGAPALADEAVDEICDPLGRVESVTGRVAADGPGSPERPLECGEWVCVDDVLTTGAGASASLLVGDVLVHVGPDTRARVGATPDRTPDVFVEQGGVRLLDPRLGGPPAGVSASGGRAAFVGSDVEVRVGAQGARFCDRDAALTVDSGGEQLTADAGSCVLVSGRGALRADGAVGAPYAVLSEICHAGPQFSPLAHVQALPPVAGPPTAGPPLPEPPGGPRRDPCDVPGAACRGVPNVVEPPPTTDPFPGGQGFPGAD